MAVITGQPTSVITRLMRQVSGKKRIMCVSATLMVQTASRLGYYLVRYCVLSKPTMAAWLRKNRNLYAKQPVILELTRHYAVGPGETLY